jgi:hypothetical protein
LDTGHHLEFFETSCFGNQTCFPSSSIRQQWFLFTSAHQKAVVLLNSSVMMGSVPISKTTVHKKAQGNEQHTKL